MEHHLWGYLRLDQCCVNVNLYHCMIQSVFGKLNFKKYYLYKKQILLLDSIIIWGVWISEGQISEVRIRQFCCTDNFEILVLFVEDWPTYKNFTAEECNQII